MTPFIGASHSGKYRIRLRQWRLPVAANTGGGHFDTAILNGVIPTCPCSTAKISKYRLTATVGDWAHWKFRSAGRRSRAGVGTCYSLALAVAANVWGISLGPIVPFCSLCGDDYSDDLFIHRTHERSRLQILLRMISGATRCHGTAPIGSRACLRLFWQRQTGSRSVLFSVSCERAPL
jgi:hypothetical protein